MDISDTTMQFSKSSLSQDSDNIHLYSANINHNVQPKLEARLFETKKKASYLKTPNRKNNTNNESKGLKSRPTTANSSNIQKATELSLMQAPATAPSINHFTDYETATKYPKDNKYLLSESNPALDDADKSIKSPTQNIRTNGTTSPANMITKSHSTKKSVASPNSPKTEKKDRPESRKIYLGTQTMVSPDPRPALRLTQSAGGRKSLSNHQSSSYSIDDDYSNQAIDTPDITRSPSWILANADDTIPVNRPPSRQKSAFPVHLADEDAMNNNHRRSNSSTKVNENNDSNITLLSRQFSKNNRSSSSLTNKPSNLVVTNDISSIPRAVTAAALPSASPSSVSSQSYVSFSSNTTSASATSGNTDDKPDDAEDSPPRPPSRQRIGAQNLFDGKRVPTKVSKTLENKNAISIDDDTCFRESDGNLDAPNVKVANMFPPYPSTAPSLGKKQNSSSSLTQMKGNQDQREDRRAYQTTFGNVSNDPIADGFAQMKQDSFNDSIKIEVNIAKNDHRIIESSSITPAIRRTIRQSKNHNPYGKVNAFVSSPKQAPINISNELSQRPKTGAGARIDFSKTSTSSNIPQSSMWIDELSETVNYFNDPYDDEDLIILPNNASNPISEIDYRPLSANKVNETGWKEVNRPKNPSLSVDRLMTASNASRNVEYIKNWECNDEDDGDYDNKPTDYPDDDCLTEDSGEAFDDDIALYSLTLESSLGQEFLSLFAPG